MILILKNDLKGFWFYEGENHILIFNKPANN